MRRGRDYSEFALKFQTWMKGKGLSAGEIAVATEISTEEVNFMLSGRYPFSLSFLSKLIACYPDFNLVELKSGLSYSMSKTEDVTESYWDELKSALRHPNEVVRIVVFYKNGTYRDFSG